MLDQFVDAAREAVAAPVADMSDVQVTEELVALRRLADAAEAAYLSRLRVFDARKISEAERVLSTRAWVRAELHVAPAETTRSLKIAKGLSSLPVVEAALAAGEIRLAHAAAIVDAAAQLGFEVIAGCQDALVAAARLDDPTRLRSALRGLGAAVDSKRAAKRAEKRDQGGWLALSRTFDGVLAIDGVLGTGEDGALVEAAIDALSSPAGPDDERTSDQRRADALVELCRRQLNSGQLPAQGGEATHVTVVTDLATLQVEAGGLGELGDGTILPGETVRRLACDAKISRVILGSDSQPLDVGSAQRAATSAQRKALRLRDRGCRFPGCRRPVEWTDAHHVRFWAHGGETDLDNLILLCRKHHTAVHEGGWAIQALDRGQFRFIDPNGCIVPDHSRATTTEIISILTESRASPEDTGSRRHAGSPPRAGPDVDSQADAA